MHTGFPITIQFSSVQSLNRVRLFESPWIAAGQASLSITISQSSLKLMFRASLFQPKILCFLRYRFLLVPDSSFGNFLLNKKQQFSLGVSVRFRVNIFKILTVFQENDKLILLKRADRQEHSRNSLRGNHLMFWFSCRKFHLGRMRTFEMQCKYE